MRRSSTLVVLAAAGLLPYCSPSYDNPFTANVTLPPPDSARVVFVSNLYASRGGAPREVFSVAEDGSGLARLTFCNGEQRQCDNVEISPAPDRRRVMVGRVTRDVNGDGRLTAAADGEALFFLDLQRGTEALITPETEKVSGLDWSPTGDVVVYTAAGVGGFDDFWRVDPNGQNRRNLTVSPGIRERRPRIDPTGLVALFERIDSTGKSQIYIFASTVSQTRVTQGGAGSDALAGTVYVVGSDADPDYSPDGRSAVFRRLTGLGNGGLGVWDVLTVRTDGTALSTVATGPAFRGAPDWGPDGRILFSEVDTAAGVTRLVVVQPDGSGRRVLVTLGSTYDISSPRWLPAAAP